MQWEPCYPLPSYDFLCWDKTMPSQTKPNTRGRDSHRNRTGGARWEFWKEALRETKILFVGGAWNLFHLWEVTILKHYIISCRIFLALRVTAKAPALKLLRLNTLTRGTTTALKSIIGMTSIPFFSKFRMRYVLRCTGTSTLSSAAPYHGVIWHIISSVL